MSGAENNRVLVVAAHPDDEVLGCGGTIARFIGEGKQVHVLILGGVTTSRFKVEASEEEFKKESFADECEKAARALGVAGLHRRDFQDNRFDTIPLLEIIKAVEATKREVVPDIVLTHDYSDLNIDHQITHQAVMTAFRPEGGNGCRKIMTFEILSSTEFQDQSRSAFIPNCYIDVGEFMAKKLDAMKCYESELKEYPHPRSLKGIEILAMKRGIEVCREYAEAFRIVREEG